jgi:hypothetical protein
MSERVYHDSLTVFSRVVNGVVTEVICADKSFIFNHVDNPNEFVQTSYNTQGGIHYDPHTREPSEDQSKALRKNFGDVGFTFDETRDAFISPQPYTSWILNEDTCLWESPTPYPENDNNYIWDEELQEWVEDEVE